MRNLLGSRLVVAIVSGALVLGMAPAAARAQDAPDPSSSPSVAPSAQDQLQALIDQRADTMVSDPTGGLGALIMQRDSVRAGGVGSFDVSVAQMDEPGLTATNVQVSIRIGEGVRVTAAAADGWTCTVRDRTVACDAAKAVTDAEAATAIAVDLAGLPDLQDSMVAVKAVVKWTQRADAAYTAANKAWPKELGDAARIITRTKTNLNDLDANGPLKIATRTSGPDVHLIAPGGEAAVLEASLIGIDKTKVTTSWRQLCLTAEELAIDPACEGAPAPQVSFSVLQTNTESDDWVATTAQIPTITSRTTFVFEVTATEGGATTRARLRYVAEPFNAVSYDPRLDTFDTLARAVQAEATSKPRPRVGYASTPLVGRIGSRGASQARTGRAVTLVVSVPGHRVVSARWRASSASKGVVTHVKRTKDAITFTIPRTFRDKGLLVSAFATVENGDVVQVDKIVEVTRALVYPRAMRQVRSLPLDEVVVTDDALPVADDAGLGMWAVDGDGTGDLVDDLTDDCETAEACTNPDEACAVFGVCGDPDATPSGTPSASATASTGTGSPEISDECAGDEFCLATAVCFGDLDNFDESGDLTQAAKDDNPFCAYIAPCLDDAEAGDGSDASVCGPEDNVVLPICELASTVREGKPLSIPFTGGGELQLTGATVSQSECGEQTTIAFADQPLVVAGQVLRVDGEIASTGVTFTSGLYVPPSSWAELGSLVGASTRLRLPQGGTVGSKLFRGAKKGEVTWSPLELKASLPGLKGLVPLPAGWTWLNTEIMVNAKGVSLTQAAEGAKDDSSSATLTADVDFTGKVTGWLAMSNMASFRDKRGVTYTVSGGGKVAWTPKEKSAASASPSPSASASPTPSDVASPSPTPAPSLSPIPEAVASARSRGLEPAADGSTSPSPSPTDSGSPSPSPSPTKAKSQWEVMVFAELKGDLEVLENLRLDHLTATYTNDDTGFALSSRVLIGAADNAFVLEAEGNFKDRKNWQITVAQDEEFTTPEPVKLTISGIKGELTAKEGILTFDVAAKASDWNPIPALKDQTLSVRITNTCEVVKKAKTVKPVDSEQVVGATPAPSASPTATPAARAILTPKDDVAPPDADAGPGVPVAPDAGAPAVPDAATPDAEAKKDPKEKDECKKDSVRMEIEISGTIVLPLASAKAATTDLEYKATAKFKFKPWEYTIVGGLNVPDGSIGPKELNLSSIQVTLTNAKIDTCMSPQLTNMEEPSGAPSVEPSAAPSGPAVVVESGSPTPTPTPTATPESASGSGQIEPAVAVRARTAEDPAPTETTPTETTPTEASPSASTSPSAAKNPTTFIIAATGSVWGQKVTFGGTFSKERICLVGTSGSDAENPITKSMKVSGDLIFAYSSVAQSLTIAKGKDGDPDRTIPLKAKSLAVVATIALPEHSSKLGFSGTGTLSAVIGFSPPSIDGTIMADFGKGINLLPKQDGPTNKLLLTKAMLSVRAAATGVEIMAGVGMDYVTIDGKPGSGIVASTTPFTAEIGLKFGSGGAGFKIVGKVDAKDESGVPNAFGQEGLTVRHLAMELTIGSSAVEFGFHGDVTLPAKWGDSIGIYPQARIELAAKISLTEPCLKFSISAGPEQDWAVDMAKAGVMFTKELGLVFAPVGCTIAGHTIPAGFGFAFDASFGPKASSKAQTQVKIIIGVTLPSATFSGLAIKADIKIPAWTLYDLKLDKTEIDIDINTVTQKYYVKVKGGISLWGSSAMIDMELKADGKAGNLTAVGKGAVVITFPGVDMNANLDFNIKVESFKLETFKLKAALKVRLLRIITLGVGAEINFEKGVLKKLEGSVNSLTSWPMSIRTVDDERITVTEGLWVASYETVQKDEQAGWQFIIGWRGKGTNGRGTPLDEKELIALWKWTGESNATIVADGVRLYVNGCDVKKGADCNTLDLRGLTAELARLDMSMSDFSLAGAILYKSLFNGVDMSGTDLTDANLDRASLINTKLVAAKLAKARLTSATLAGADLTRADLSGADLTGASLKGANLTGAKLTGATLTGATTTKSTICPNGLPGPCTGDPWPAVTYLTVGSCTLKPMASCPGVDLTSLQGYRGKRVGYDLSGMDLSGANLANLDLSGADITDTNLTDANLRRARLEGTTLTGANLTGANLRTTTIVLSDFTGATLTGVKITFESQCDKACGEVPWPRPVHDQGAVGADGVYAVGACRFTTAMNCPGADLSHAQFPVNRDSALSSAVLPNANLSDQELWNVNLRNANLRNANLRGVVLQSADLRRADLVGADLGMADLRGANFSGANLGGANLKYADVADAKFDRTKTDVSTTCPNGLAGPCTGVEWSPAPSYSREPLPCKLSCGRWELTGYNLSDQDLSGFGFDGANLQYRDLSGSNLSDATFVATRLGQADLYKVNARRASFKRANLASADLSYADLRETDLRWADLKDATLTGAKLDGARTNASTTCPDGQRGPCKGAQWTLAVQAPVGLVVNGCSLEPETHCEDLDIARAQLAGIDLTGAWLPRLKGDDVVLDRATLIGARLADAHLRRASLVGADLSNAALERVFLNAAKLKGATLVRADAEEAQLERIDVSGAKMQGFRARASNLGFANMRNADLRGAQLGAASMFQADLESANLEGANLEKADLSEAILVDANLKDAYLPDARLVATRIDSVKMPGAKLVDALLRGIHFTRVDARDANLSGATLDGVTFANADFSGANLAGAKLVNVNFDGANLSKANLTNVQLGHVNFHGSDLTGAMGADKRVLDNRIDGSTICPNGERAFVARGWFKSWWECKGW